METNEREMLELAADAITLMAKAKILSELLPDDVSEGDCEFTIRTTQKFKKVLDDLSADILEGGVTEEGTNILLLDLIRRGIGHMAKTMSLEDEIETAKARIRSVLQTKEV
jgi:hypothetical protein